MATTDPPDSSWTVVLRRQPTRLLEGQPEGGYTDMYEIICSDCGDDPDLDYREVSPRLQLVRGPYPPAAGVSAYKHHLKLHEQMQRATGTKAAIALLMGAYLAVNGGQRGVNGTRPPPGPRNAASPAAAARAAGPGTPQMTAVARHRQPSRSPSSRERVTAAPAIRMEKLTRSFRRRTP